jgi:hypothetical protein
MLDQRWFRRSQEHPNPAVEKVARVFCEWVATELKIPVPTIFWFGDADFPEVEEHETKCRGPHEATYPIDPFDVQCGYFFWVEEDVPGGFTSHFADGRILIRIRSDFELSAMLGTIAHECKHRAQNMEHTDFWRYENGPAAEYDAYEYEKEIAVTASINETTAKFKQDSNG